MTKDVRKEIEKLIKKEPQGLLIKDIADKLGVHRHTARKYIDIMASEGKIKRRRVGKATICYPNTRRKIKGFVFSILLLFIMCNNAWALSDCTGTDVSPCHQCDAYSINISIFYPNGSIAAYTLNTTIDSEGSCTCDCYVEDCCATDTYKNQTATWFVDYTYCSVEGDYNASMDVNASQTDSTWEDSTNTTLYTVNWDSDQNWCQCKVGSNKWNIGFGPGTTGSCCTDDASEYVRTRLCDAGTCATDGTDDACCNATNACVWESTCHLDTYIHPSLAGVTCDDGTWIGGFPQWRNQETNDTDNIIPPGLAFNLSAEGYDSNGVDYAWLETNESGGTWINYSGSYSGNYNSPMDMGDVVAWTWSNFTWINTSTTSGTYVGWRIWFNDTSDNTNGTDIMQFLVDNIPDSYYVNITPANPVDISNLYLYVQCRDEDGDDSLTAYWNWLKDDVVQFTGSSVVSNGTTTYVDSVTANNLTEGDVWKVQFWCGDGYANSTSLNDSVYVDAGPLHYMEVKLTINGTGNSVYVPGIGERSASNLGFTTTNPPDFYATTYANNIMYGLVFFYKKAYSIKATNNSENHSIYINTSMKSSNVFLVSSRGDWTNIHDHIDMLEAGTFLMNHLPSFGFGLGTGSVIRIILDYNNIDIIDESVFGSGKKKIYMTNQNSGTNKIVNVTVS